MELRLEKAQLALLERQHLQHRLQSILTSIVPSPEKECSLYTKKIQEEPLQSLIVLFDQGIDPDPAFSGPCLTRIYLNEERQLCLALWPEDKEKKKNRQELLLQNVSSFAFHFLCRNADQTIEWKKEWPKKDHTDIPSLIRLDIWQEMDPKEDPHLQLAFILPSQDPPIFYQEKTKL